MKKTPFLYTCLFLATLAGLAALFYLPYRTVKEKTIESFRNEQLLLARQASRGIQNSLTMYSSGLRYFAGHPSIVHLDDKGRSMLQNFYAIHTPGIISIARLDELGEVVFRITNSKLLSDQQLTETFSQIAVPPKPFLQDIFCRGRVLAAFSYPVYDGNTPSGIISFILSFDQLISKFVFPLKTTHNRRSWVINRDGIVLDCPNPAHSGAHIDQATESAHASSLLDIMREMAKGAQGAGAFTFRDDNGGGTIPEQNHVVFMPIELPGANHWSIAVATPEKYVLANMKRFRNSWLLSSGVAICILLVLSFFLVRSMILAGEEKKRIRFEDQLVELMDFTPIGIIVYDVRGALLYANNTAKEMWRQNTADDLHGINVFDFIHPDYRNFVKDRFKDVMRGGTSEPAVVKVLLPGSVEKNIEISTAPFQFSGQRCGVSVIQDVSQRLRIEEEQRRLATAMANTNDSIVITDKGGIIEYINPAFSRITGYDREEVIGRNPRVLKSGRHDRAFYENMWQTLLQGKVWEGKLINRKKDGTLFTELASISPVRDATGRITHFVAVKRDISHEVELESQLYQAQKMEAIGTLAGGIAHDFNNILGAIIGFTDISIMQTPRDSPVYDNLLHIRNSGRRAADLIQQILTFSRQAAHREKIPVAIGPLLKETLKLLRASIPTTIDMHLDVNEPEGWVIADPVQIQQVIMNLCTNAFHAMSHGGTLTISLNKLELDDFRAPCLADSSSCIELKVADTGHGIDRAILDRIFDPFFTTKEPGVGTGMGLSVVHGIIKDLGGMITVDSDQEGSTFTILIPETTPPARDEKPVESNLPLGSESILVVDDEKDIRETCRMMLEQLGYQVRVCENPVTALALIKDPANHFDLVISDQTMPEMTGSELLQQILHIRPELPVILCTGFSEELTDETAVQRGARMLLMKPILFRQLAESLRKILDSSDPVGTEPS